MFFFLHVPNTVANSTEICIVETSSYDDYLMKASQRTCCRNYLSRAVNLSRAQGDHNRD